MPSARCSFDVKATFQAGSQTGSPQTECAVDLVLSYPLKLGGEEVNPAQRLAGEGAAQNVSMLGEIRRYHSRFQRLVIGRRQPAAPLHSPPRP
jgi:hypothetical protein